MASAGDTCDKAVPDVDRTVAPTPVAAPTPATAPVLTKSRLLTAFSPWSFRFFCLLSGFLSMRLPLLKRYRVNCQPTFTVWFAKITLRSPREGIHDEVT